MKSLTMALVLILTTSNIAISARNDESLRLKMTRLGYSRSSRDDFEKELFPEHARPPDISRSDHYHRVYRNRTSGVDLGGSVGVIELPSAFTQRRDYTTISGRYLYARGSFRTREDTFNRKKAIHLLQLLHGFNDNFEIGLGQTRLSSDIETITGTTGFRSYNADTVLNTVSLKHSFQFKGLNVAMGGHFTDLAAEDQLLVDIMDNERLNDIYITITEDVHQKMLGHLVVRNSFFRGSENRVLMADRDSTVSVGIGLEYFHNREYTMLAELKKIYSDFIVRPDDLLMNVGIRYEARRLLFDVFALGINDNSSTSYAYGVGYRF